MGGNFSKKSGMLRCRVIGVEHIGTRFSILGESCRERLKEAAMSQAKAVQKEAKALSRAQLHRRTGKTHRGFMTREIDKGGEVGALVKIRWYVTRFWERGFGHGKRIRIKGHLRNNSKRVVTRWEPVRKYKRKTTIKKVIVSQEQFFVRAHDRVINQKARPALKPAFNGARSEIRAALEQALMGAVHGA